MYKHNLPITYNSPILKYMFRILMQESGNSPVRAILNRIRRTQPELPRIYKNCNISIRTEDLQAPNVYMPRAALNCKLCRILHGNSILHCAILLRAHLFLSK
jgi:hypothetical protein